MYEQIPKELKDLNQWGIFRKIWKPERNKYTKIPMNPFTGGGGMSNNSDTWSDFKTAVQAIDKFQADGLAFYFTPPYVGLDVDNVAEELEAYTQGDTNNIVGDYMNHTNSYAEISISGKGLHVIVKGEIPGDRRRHKNCEMYSTDRFFALTGNFFGNPDNDLIRNTDVSYLYKKYIEPDTKVVSIFDSGAKNKIENDLTSNEVIKTAIASKSGERFRRLYQGEWQGLYSSQSEADLAFANDLAFWTAKDFSKMDDIFRSSGLMRDKYDEKHGKTTYGVGLLNKAIADVGDTYHPKNTDEYFLSIPGVTTAETKKKEKLYSYDDTGNAERFYDVYHDVTRFNTTSKKWMYFDGQVWNTDNTFVIDRLFNKIVEKLPDEKLHMIPGSEDDEDEAKKIRAKFIKKSRQNSGKTAALNEIKKLIPATPDEFDTQMNVINTPSGYVDLSNGQLHETTFNDKFTKITLAEYSPTASAPMWEAFLNQIFVGNQEIINFMQRFVGYILTGTMSEQIFGILFGKGNEKNGANGKSVFLETLREIFKSYSTTINPETLLVNKFGGTDSSTMGELANTKGARLIVTSETDEDVRLSESLVKRMTGGEAITAKKLYQEPFSFMPTGTILMSTNNKPIIRGTDHGIWRRLVFIPFLAQIPESQKDVHLKDKLLREQSGILNWAVDGALIWQREGLKIPDSVKSESNEYRAEMDTVGKFISEVAEISPESRVSNTTIALAWDNWERINASGMSKRKLNRELGNRYERYRTENERGFIGFKIRDDLKSNDAFSF